MDGQDTKKKVIETMKPRENKEWNNEQTTENKVEERTHKRAMRKRRWKVGGTGKLGGGESDDGK